MIESTLFRIPMWSIPTLNFSTKRPQLTEMLSDFPETKQELQMFSTNRQMPRNGLKDKFVEIVGEELNMLSEKLGRDIVINDVWSVSYTRGEYHTIHNHGSTGLAGILYLSYPEGSAPTQYVQPWNDFTSDRTIYFPSKVSEGDITVTPQFVSHFTEPHQGDIPKRIIAWDMDIK